MSNWWDGFFTGLWEEMQLALSSDEENRAATDRIEQALRLASPAHILDVPCGNGRISVELAARGHEVTGVDLSDAFLAAASVNAERRSVHANWEQADMRELPFAADFDLAINFGGSFGYFDDEGNARTAASAFQALRTGGRYLIDVPSAETVLPRFRERHWFAVEEFLVLSENRYDLERGRNETDWTIVGPDGLREHRHSSMRLYAYHELVSLLRGVGFTGFEAFDAADVEPFHIGASRLMVVATK